MNRADLIKIADVVYDTLAISKKVKLNLFLHKNKDIIDKELDILEKIIKASDGFKEFETKRNALCIEHADKDENNSPIINDKNEFVGLRENKEFEEKMDIILEEYKEDIKEHKIKINEYNELLKEEIDIQFEKFDVELIPDDLVTGLQLEILTPLFME